MKMLVASLSLGKFKNEAELFSLPVSDDNVILMGEMIALQVFRNVLMFDYNPVTLKNYESYCKRFLFPSLGGLPISSIKTIDISNIMATVQGRVYEDLRVVLNSVFKYALANSLISNRVQLRRFQKGIYYNSKQQDRR